MSSFPKLPKRQYVRGNIWPVEIVPISTLTHEWESERRVYGDLDTSRKTVRIGREQSLQDQWASLYHENLHLGLWLANQTGHIRLDLGSFEEPIIERLEEHTWPILRDNFWRWTDR